MFANESKGNMKHTKQEIQDALDRQFDWRPTYFIWQEIPPSKYGMTKLTTPSKQVSGLIFVLMNMRLKIVMSLMEKLHI